MKVFEENIKMNKSRSNILEHAQEYAKSVAFVRQTKNIVEGEVFFGKNINSRKDAVDTDANAFDIGN